MSQSVDEQNLALEQFRPKLRIDPLMRPIHRFLEVEASGGIVLIFAAIVALFLANTSLASWYAEIWETKLGGSFGGYQFEMSLQHFINDGLMTLFFFVVGLEIKREMVFGELRSFSRAAFPIAAGLGGMLIPVAVFLGLRWGDVGDSGWAIPMATDIAFVVGFLSLLGKRVPTLLKVSLLAIAIADDIGAVIVIAVAYAQGFSREFLIAGLAVYGLVFAMNTLGVRRIFPYVLVGLGMWVCFYKSGVHPTMVGVLLGLATPSKRLVNSIRLKEFVDAFRRQLAKEDEANPVDRYPMRAVGTEALAPLERMEVDLHPWVAFVIMPLFALANAGVPIELSALESGVAWAVILGLVVGKPLGIFGFAWFFHVTKILPFPSGITAKVFFAASCLCGIGFTMSLFIASLALQGELLVAAKTGVLVGSLFSAGLGLFFLHRFLERRVGELDTEV